MADDEELAEGMRWLLDGAAAIVVIVGAYNGLGPFVGRWILRSDPFLVLPLRLRSPWWWITALLVIAASVVLLGVIDAGKQRWASTTPRRGARHDER